MKFAGNETLSICLDIHINSHIQKRRVPTYDSLNLFYLCWPSDPQLGAIAWSWEYIAIVKRIGTARHTTAKKKKSVKREFLSLRVVAGKMNDTNMMYKNLAIDCMYFWVK